MQLRGYTTGDFSRGVPLWKEACWHVIRAIFFQLPLPWPSALRVGWLRWFGASIGVRVVVRSQVNVTFPWRLIVGDDVWLGEEVLILSLAPVTIESNVCLSQRAFLCTGSHNFRSPGFDLITKPIVIRERSWVAAQVFVGPGVEVGADSLLAAGAVVVASVPPGSLVRGNPATVQPLEAAAAERPAPR